MSSLDFDLDAQISNLEIEWRLAYDTSMVARAEYQALSAQRSVAFEVLDAARDRLERAESKKSRIMGRIEHLETTVLRRTGG